MSTTAVESPSEEEVRIGQNGWVKKDIKKKKISNPPMNKNDQSLSYQDCRVLSDKSEGITLNNLEFRCYEEGISMDSAKSQTNLARPIFIHLI